MARGTLVDSIEEARNMDSCLRIRRAPARRKHADDGLTSGDWETVGLHRCMPPKRILNAIVVAEDSGHVCERLSGQWTVRLPRNDEERHLISGAILNLFGIVEDATEKKKSVIVFGHASSKPMEYLCNRQAAMLATLLVEDSVTAMASPYMKEQRSVALTFQEFWETKIMGDTLVIFRIQSILREPERRWVRERGTEVAPGFRGRSELVTAITPMSEFEAVDFMKVLVVLAPKWHQTTGEGQEECFCRVFVTQGRNSEPDDFHYVAALKKALWIARSRRRLGCSPRVRVLPEDACRALNCGSLPPTEPPTLTGGVTYGCFSMLLDLVKGHARPTFQVTPAEGTKRLLWASLEHDASQVIATMLGTRGYVWTPSSHWLLPQCMREGVFVLLMCHCLRPASLLASLPLEVLFMLFTEYVKSTSALLCSGLPRNAHT